MFARELNTIEMRRLYGRVTGSPQDAESVLVSFYDIALAEQGSTFEDEESIDPTEFRIPEAQWVEIAELLNHTHDIHDEDTGMIVSTFNGALQWMNSGPSGS